MERVWGHTSDIRSNTVDAFVSTLRRKVDGPGDATLAAMETLPADAILASWNSGTLTFRSARTVVNLDGLVNSWDYHLETRRDLCEYWRRTGVTHLVDFFDFTADPSVAVRLSRLCRAAPSRLDERTTPRIRADCDLRARPLAARGESSAAFDER